MIGFIYNIVFGWFASASQFIKNKRLDILFWILYKNIANGWEIVKK